MMMISPSGIIDSGTVAIVTYLIGFIKFIIFFGISLIVLFLLNTFS